MILRVTFTNGLKRDFKDSDTLSIRNYPVSETRRSGYEKTRDYPPEWSKFTQLRVTVLAIGHDVSIGGEVVKVLTIESVN